MIRLLIVATLLSLSSFAGNFASGTTTCAASGNKLVITLTAPVTVNVVVVQAAYSNAGTITIGQSTITSSANGPLLNPGDSFALASTNFSGVPTTQLFFACSNSGDKVNWTYLQ